MKPTSNSTNRQQLWPLAAWIAAGASLSWLTGSDWPTIIACGIIIMCLTYAAQKLIARYDAWLTSRIENPETPTWKIAINGVTAGSITDAEYAAIQQKVFRNKRLIGAQLLETAKLVARMINHTLRDIPLILFWLFVVMYVANPETILSITQPLLAGNADLIAPTLDLILKMIGLLAIVLPAMALLMGNSISYRNHYTEEIALLLRRHCTSPADGEVELFALRIKS